MKLYLVQHGDALPEHIDPERHLSDVGRDDVACLAEFLARRHVSVDRIGHSGKTRARETAEILATEIAPEVVPEQLPGLNPNDPVEAVAAQAAEWTADTMLVGHLPFMARLAAVLLTGRSEPPVCAFQPGSVACLAREETHWTLVWMLRPELFAGRG